MKRSEFIQKIGLLTLAGSAMKIDALGKATSGFAPTERMPVLFVGHGSPMNAIEDNSFTRGMRAVAEVLPRPTAILMVSAHWETQGTYVTIQERPRTIHDFGGFPQALFDVQYPAPGSPWLAAETQAAIKKAEVRADESWGLDHGCWSVTRNLFPEADVPIIQLSLDYRKDAAYHYELAAELQSLRNKGVLIIGSGNMVHNFSYMSLKDGMKSFNEPYGLDWAIEANELFKRLIQDNDARALTHYVSLGRPAQLAVPTPEHYLPMLYAIAQRSPRDEVSFFNDAAVGGSFTMTSVLIH